MHRLKSESLLRNGLYIMGITAVTAGFGFFFWIVATHALSAHEVGRAAALVSAMLLVALFTNLGVGQVLITRLPSREPGHDWSLTVMTCLLACGVASLVGGAIAAILLPTLVPALKGGLSPVTFLILPLGVVGAACFVVIDFACIAERHAKYAFVRNGIAAVIRLALVAMTSLVALDGASWIVVVWTASFWLVNVSSMVRVFPRLGHDFRPTLRGWRGELRAIRGLIAGHQSINIGAQASAYLLPVIVSSRLGPTENAYFYTTFMLASALFFVAPAIANALFAEGAHRPENLGRDARRAAKYILVLVGPPAVVLLLAGGAILGLFGAAYADEGQSLLLILIFASVFDSIYQLAIAALRVRHNLSEAAIATWVMLTLAIGASWILLPTHGIDGAGIGWLLGKVGGMCVALYLVWRTRGPAAAENWAG